MSQTFIRVTELPRLSYSADATATIAGGDTVEQLEVGKELQQRDWIKLLRWSLTTIRPLEYSSQGPRSCSTCLPVSDVGKSMRRWNCRTQSIHTVSRGWCHWLLKIQGRGKYNLFALNRLSIFELQVASLILPQFTVSNAAGPHTSRMHPPDGLPSHVDSAHKTPSIIGVAQHAAAHLCSANMDSTEHTVGCCGADQ